MTNPFQAEKFCFVTVGATAAFDALIRAVLRPDFLRALARHSYTNLLVQFGRGGQELFVELAEALGRDTETFGITVQGFDLTKKLRECMRVTRGECGRSEGVVFCHAGTGSVLDALRLGVPIVMVPNTTLLDNHQVEFAEQMASMGYAVHGDIDGLAKSLDAVENMRGDGTFTKPPVNSGDPARVPGLAAVIDEELGLDCAVRID